MASAPQPIAVTPTTLITIKVVYEGNNRKFKLPLQDLTASSFSERIRSILQIPENQGFTLERFSDSGNAYLALEQNNLSAYKQLYRAAKAKLKLRIRATLVGDETKSQQKEVHKSDEPSSELVTQPLNPLSAHTSYSGTFEKPCQKEATKSTPTKDFGCVHARDQFFHQLINISRERELGRRMKEVPVQIPNGPWQIFCNACDKPLADAHFHCSICDGGDYDLCETCVEAGKTCEGDGHWLIKRFIKHGKVLNSTTETLPPKTRVSTDAAKAIPGAFESDVKAEILAQEANRTCNSCVRVLPENLLCTCKDCLDFDLCVPCLGTKHNHHPAHTFEPIASTMSVDEELRTLCAPGSNVRHHAICDGCEEPIYGVRNKCLSCPDWDFCTTCFESAKTSHPDHRFVPVYDTLEGGVTSKPLHYGILCDGPLCTGKTGKAYIKGVRYKCAVCHDTDFCANCEAHPSNRHNESHPLIKFKIAVKGANITTVENRPGQAPNFMGDKVAFDSSGQPRRRHMAAMVSQWNASAQSSPSNIPAVKQSQVTEHKNTTQEFVSEAQIIESNSQDVNSAELDAHFLSDTIVDGTKMEPCTNFTQSWLIRNPGPHSWPIGCSVLFVAGDPMPRLSTECTSVDSTGVPKSVSTTEIVPTGGEFEFTVLLKSPSRPGRSISYFRLKTPDGTPFGHKLWCDVEVTSAIDRKTSIRGSLNAGTLADYQTQLMMLEQQQKMRQLVARQQRQAATPAMAERTSFAASQMRLLAVEQREKMRVLTQSRDHEAISIDLSSSAATKEANLIEQTERQYNAGTQQVSQSYIKEGRTQEHPSSVAEGVMVFPTLEKESPSSSTYQDATSARSTTTIQPVDAKVKTEVTSEVETETETETVTASEPIVEERFEDLESVEYENSDEEDGFMTDEEYDILDASDEEVPGHAKRV